MNKESNFKLLEKKAKKLKSLHKGTAFELIGGKLDKISSKQVKAHFSLNNVSRQAFGLLHGGIYAYVAESLASLGAWMSVDHKTKACLGIEISASHLKAVAEPGAKVFATANCLKSGKSMQIWSIEFKDKEKDLLSVARCSVFIKNISAKTADNRSSGKK